MDLRALPIFTIDSAETKDIDDAISLTTVSYTHLLTSKYSGTEVKVDGEECTIVRQSDILAIVE